MDLAQTQTGYLLIDKPHGITSHDVVDRLRKILGVKKIGHAGTLDPLATGLLIVLVGRSATKLSDQLRGLDKDYEVSMLIGVSHDSLDIDGEETERITADDTRLDIDRRTIEDVLQGLVGTYEQEVPMFSAVKIAGKKLYEHGRHERRTGDTTTIHLPTRNVTISNCELISLHKNDDGYPVVSFKTSVSSGTYTRALVRDIGKKLNVPVTQCSLRRTRIGEFIVDDTVTLDEATKDDIIPLSRLNGILGLGAIV
ncbi:tRNA pseudouridine(55) synthase TruB [candidate division WWE3 bacterium]|uniref:tRNA pseudouridine synthase B n=1 Tax=candidate division WWE3 bacterium TaxID=2053526 RepID=A0A955RQQ0_UNCKA|nr:tRNA pseudouridine(55) synthase TruB [candidate division WWE3 bacterium]